MPIINGQGRVAVRVTGGAPAPSASYLLDTYGGAAAAYSLRKLSSTYSGSAIRVRRSSDNTEMNIGFDGSGNLDTTALTSFVGAGNGFVVIWYDQSGNGKNASNNSATNQPQIVTSGVVNSQNSKPTIQSDGINDSLMFNLGVTNTPLSVFYCTKRISGTGYVYDWAIGQRGFTEPYIPNTSFSSGYETNTQNFFMWSGNAVHTLGNSTLNTFYLKNMLVLTSSPKLTFYKNNTLQSVSTQPDNISTDGIGSLFSDVRTTYSQNLYGVMSEIIIYNSDQSSNRSAINSNINTYYSIYPSDADAAAFVSAAGITDSTQQSAVNTLVTSLKSAGIWTKMKAIYPFVGGTASSHKFNLKDPRDLDAAYRLVFNGGWTHTGNGAEANGTNGYADTKLNPVTSLSLYNAHSSVYQRKTTLNYGFDIGNTNSGVWNKEFLLTSYRNNGNAESGLYDLYGQGYIQGTVTNAAGFTQNSVTSNTSTKLYKNGSVIGSNTNLNSSEPNNCSLYIGGVNTSTNMVEAHNGQYAFASIGDGLTDAEASAFYTAVQAFQTTLGRQV